MADSGHQVSIIIVKKHTINWNSTKFLVGRFFFFFGMIPM